MSVMNSELNLFIGEVFSLKGRVNTGQILGFVKSLTLRNHFRNPIGGSKDCFRRMGMRNMASIKLSLLNEQRTSEQFPYLIVKNQCFLVFAF